jgi:murein DD-endopeptidase MepM/ murein hydrolase activator NlpD
MNIFPSLKGKWVNINLDEESKNTQLDLSDPLVCSNWISDLHRSLDADYSYGGFLEDRTHIWRFHPSEKSKSLIHLGVDYNVPSNTPVSLPMDAKVFHIMKDPRNSRGWGGRVIFLLDDGNYLLYGHLKQDISLKSGQLCAKGDIVGTVGEINENGNWFPHLHVQLMDPDFISYFASRLNSIDGYLPIDHPLLKYVIDPKKVITITNND